MALIGLGFRSLSMSPASIGPVKAMILSLNAKKAAETVGELLGADGRGNTLRPQLAQFAKAEGLPL
jgi:phosphotransferase system enzyme I (PtsP)